MGKGQFKWSVRKPWALVVLVAIVLVVMAGYLLQFNQGKGNPISPLITQESAGVYGLDKGWIENLQRWIQISYVDYGDYAGFANVDAEIIVPSLYATYPSSHILSILERTLDDTDSIINWIEGLYKESGYYDDQGTDAPLLIETYWALSTISILGGKINHREQIKSFVCKNLADNHDLVLHSKQEDLTHNDIINSTYFSIQILQLLKEDAKHACGMSTIQDILQYVRNYVDNNLTSTAPKINEENAGIIITAIYIISSIDPDIIPDNAVYRLSNISSQIKYLPEEIISVPMLNNLLDALDVLGIHNDTLDTQIKRFLENKIFPKQNIKGGFGSSVTIEPMMTMEVVKLAARVGIPYPHADILIENILRHRIREGWVNFFLVDPSVDATFYALALTSRLGDMNSFDKDKIVRYLNFIFQHGNLPHRTSGGSPSYAYFYNLYYAVRAYKLLEGHINSPLRRQLIASITDASHSLLASKQDAGMLIHNTVFLALLLKEVNSKLDKDVEQLLQEGIASLHEFLKNPEYVDIRALYYLYALESSMYEHNSLPDKATIVQGVLRLKSPEGVFRRNPKVPVPDIDSTYLALSILNDMGARSEIDPEAVRTFVLACKARYGFNYAPPRLLEKMGADLSPDFKVTYEGWVLLEQYGKVPK